MASNAENVPFDDVIMNCCIQIQISPQFGPNNPAHIKPALLQIMA